MASLITASEGIERAKAFIDTFLADENMRRSVALLGPKPNDPVMAMEQLLEYAFSQGFEFTADDYSEASSDYLDSAYGATEVASTCCCRSSPTSSSSLPRSYSLGEDDSF